MENYYRNIFYLSSGVDCVFDKETCKICDVNANFETIIGHKKGCSINDLFTVPSDLVQFSHTVSAFSQFHEFNEMETSSVNGELLKVRWKMTDLMDRNKILLSGLMSSTNNCTEEEEIPFPFTKSELITLVQNCPMCIHCVVDGVVVWANQTLLNVLGVEYDEYVNIQPKKYLEQYLVDPNAIYAAGMKVRGGETVHNFPHRLIAKDGTIKYFTCELDSFRRADGSVIFRGFLRHDDEVSFSEAVANDQVQKYADIAAEKDSFIRIMFHEIKTPLHNLEMGFNAFMSDTKLDRSLTDDLKLQIEKCSGTVEDLSFATMFESDQVLHPRPINIQLRQELDVIVELMNHEMELNNKSIQIERRFEEGMPEVVAVDKSILRVMSNLISNAVKYCCNDGNVLITLSYKTESRLVAGESFNLSGEDKVENHSFNFSVTNSVNQAMDQTLVNKMFQNCFSRLVTDGQSVVNNAKSDCSGSSNQSPKVKSALISQSLTSSDGLGLGVYVSYNIIQSLGGLLECSGDNSHSTFSFTVSVDKALSVTPRLNTEPTVTWSSVSDSNVGGRHVLPSESGDGCTKSSGSQDGIKKGSDSGVVSRSIVGPKSIPLVLVVDDSPICRKVLVKQLESNGFATRVACDGQEACDMLKHRLVPYHIVLMDLRMPIMDGITATRIIKEREHCSDLPIVIVTAETGEDVRSEAMAAKASYFISKPVKMNELLEVMDKFINLRKVRFSNVSIRVSSVIVAAAAKHMEYSLDKETASYYNWMYARNIPMKILKVDGYIYDKRKFRCSVRFNEVHTLQLLNMSYLSSKSLQHVVSVCTNLTKLNLEYTFSGLPVHVKNLTSLTVQMSQTTTYFQLYSWIIEQCNKLHTLEIFGPNRVEHSNDMSFLNQVIQKNSTTLTNLCLWSDCSVPSELLNCSHLEKVFISVIKLEWPQVVSIMTKLVTIDFSIGTRHTKIDYEKSDQRLDIYCQDITEDVICDILSSFKGLKGIFVYSTRPITDLLFHIIADLFSFTLIHLYLVIPCHATVQGLYKLFVCCKLLESMKVGTSLLSASDICNTIIDAKPNNLKTLHILMDGVSDVLIAKLLKSVPTLKDFHS